MTRNRTELLYSLLKQRILLLDGGMGTMIQRHNLSEADFRGERFADWPSDLQGNNDLLILTQAKLIQEIEKAYLDAESERLGHAKIVYLLNTLTPRQREAFQLYYLDERKYDEICDIMNMNYHSVRNLVHRGMIKLRTAAV